MKKWLGLCAVVICLAGASKEDTRAFKFEGTVADKSNGGLLPESVIEVYEGNKVVYSLQIDKKGKFQANLFGSGSYTIDISHDGFYPKRVVIHTNVPENIKKIPLFKFEIELIRKSDYEDLEEVDPLSTSIFDFPYVIFEWDSEYEDFSYREAYTEHIKSQYELVDNLH